MHNHFKLTFFLAAAVAAVSPLIPAANAGVIGPWPLTQPYLWDTAPFSPVCGTVSVVAPDVLQMSGIGTGSKNASWLPYGGTYAERLCIARFLFSTPVTNVHARVYDPATSGSCGWAIILKDNSGRILDFGLRTFFANKQITAHQYDGTNWTNLYFADRNLKANDYYSMNFTNNSDGTIAWSLESMLWDSVNQVFNFYTNSANTTVTYGNITEVYLNAMTKDTTTANFKWTEFSVSPQVYSPPTLNMAPSGSDLLFSWRSPWNTFSLQANADLNTTTWTNVPNATSDDGTNVTVTIPVGSGNLFYRLAK